MPDDALDAKESIADFMDAVNMAPQALEGWLQSEESREAGHKVEGGESTGHSSGW